MYLPKIVEIIEKEIIVTTGAYTKLKGILTDEVYSRENKNKAVFLNLVFEKTNKTMEKNLVRIFKEDSKLFDFKENFGNPRSVFTSIQGDFEFDFSEHNVLKEYILEKVNKVNARYKEMADKMEKQQSLEKKEIPNNYTEARASNRSLSTLLGNVLDYKSYLFENNNYSDRAVLDLDVDFQRDIVWNLKQKQDLIISLLNDIPIGGFYINSINIYAEHKKDSSKTLQEYSEIDEVLYDGKQRINAIIEYMLGEFSIVYNGEEYYFGNLDFNTQRKITNKTVNVYHTEFNDKNELIDFYILLNGNQTAHKQEDFEKARSFKK